MDHHVPEEATGPGDIGDRRRGRVARQDRDEFDRADLSRGEPLLEGTEMRVEPAVEADHQRRAGPLDHPEAAADPFG